MKRRLFPRFHVHFALALLAAGVVASAQVSQEDAMAKLKAREEARKASTQSSPEDVAIVRSINKDLKQENTSLKTENSRLQTDNDRLRLENDKLKKDLAEAKRVANSGDPKSKTIFDGLEKEVNKK